jgi:hypothetical protein
MPRLKDLAHLRLDAWRQTKYSPLHVFDPNSLYLLKGFERAFDAYAAYFTYSTLFTSIQTTQSRACQPLLSVDGLHEWNPGLLRDSASTRPMAVHMLPSAEAGHEPTSLDNIIPPAYTSTDYHCPIGRKLPFYGEISHTELPRTQRQYVDSPTEEYGGLQAQKHHGCT